MNRSAPILHPVSLAALAVLVVNDHVLKATFPSWWTGKLSDVAGLAFAPLLVTAAVALVTRRDVTQRAVVTAAVVVGAGFTAIKLWAPAGDLYRLAVAALQWPLHAVPALLGGAATPGLGRAQLAMDATDLIALPALLVPAWLATSYASTPRKMRPGILRVSARRRSRRSRRWRRPSGRR